MNDNQGRRRSLRLRGYDYSRAGAYFVTICTADRGSLFGKIVDGEMIENHYAKITHHCWEDLPNHYSHVTLDAFVVMPNHMHGIMVLSEEETNAEDVAVIAGTDPVGAGFKPAPTPEPAPTLGLGEARNAPVRHGLPEIVRALKTYSARRINALRGTPGVAVWQRGYYEHVIRNERALRRIQQYIISNPRNWRKDREYVPERRL